MQQSRGAPPGVDHEDTRPREGAQRVQRREGKAGRKGGHGCHEGLSDMF